MKNKTGLLVGIFVVLAVASFALNASAPAASGFSTSVEIGRSDKHPEAYSVAVRVSDLAEGKVVAAPKLLVASGETAEASSELEDGAVCTVSAQIEAGGRAAHYTAKISRAGALLAQHETDVALP